jgi:hypothetical protein
MWASGAESTDDALFSDDNSDDKCTAFKVLSRNDENNDDCINLIEPGFFDDCTFV